VSPSATLTFIGSKVSDDEAPMRNHVGAWPGKRDTPQFPETSVLPVIRQESLVRLAFENRFAILRIKYKLSYVAQVFWAESAKC
jgi:hypothetical protein